MKRFFSAFFAFVTVFLLCAAALPVSAEDITINVYNWGEYISDGSEDSLDVNAEFTKATGIKVNYSTYASNEDLYAKLKSGATGYDVIIPSDYMLKRLADEGMLEELDFANIPNYQYVYDDFKGLYYDPDEKYTVPYTYGIIGVIYNSARVDETDVADKSWDLLWNEKYNKMILQFNNSRDAFGTAMYLEGIDVNTTDEALWRRALSKLAEQKPIVQSYVMDEIYNKMESGEAWISSYYVGDYLSMYENNEDRHLNQKRQTAGHRINIIFLVQLHNFFIHFFRIVFIFFLYIFQLWLHFLHIHRRFHLLLHQRIQNQF